MPIKACLNASFLSLPFSRSNWKRDRSCRLKALMVRAPAKILDMDLTASALASSWAFPSFARGREKPNWAQKAISPTATAPRPMRQSITNTAIDENKAAIILFKKGAKALPYISLALVASVLMAAMPSPECFSLSGPVFIKALKRLISKSRLA